MKNAKGLAAIAMVLALASCNFTNSSGSDVSGSEKPEGYYLADAKETLAAYRDRGVFASPEACPTVGSPKILVLPVVFYDIADTHAYTESEVAMLKEAFTSTTLQDEGAFHSLKEYYRISSYGKLNLDITVHDPISLTVTQSDYEESYDYYSADIVIEDALSQMVAAGEDLSDYDSDDDGSIDGIHIVYKTDRTVGINAIWWHYAYFYLSETPSEWTTRPNVYFFSGFVGTDNGVYEGKPDTHTIIHETGHMLGQFDLYDYDYIESPTTGVDMMDFNVGDHCAYTKMMFGWADPYVVDGTSDDFSITLKPFESTGEFVLLKNTSVDPWNGTPFDEYLTLSYYTPTGLNELDSKGYADWHGYGTYTANGLQVFHVDSRGFVADEMPEDWNIIKAHYYEPGVDDPEDWYYMTATNTGSTSCEIDENGYFVDGNSRHRLIEAIASDGVDYFSGEGPTGRTYPGNNMHLFGIGEAYGGSTYTNESMKDYFVNGTSFNDGSVLDYSFEVTAMDDNGITIHFERTEI